MEAFTYRLSLLTELSQRLLASASTPASLSRRVASSAASRLDELNWILTASPSSTLYFVCCPPALTVSSALGYLPPLFKAPAAASTAPPRGRGLKIILGVSLGGGVGGVSGCVGVERGLTWVCFWLFSVVSVLRFAAS